MDYTILFTPTGDKAAPGAAVGGKQVDENGHATTGSGILWRPYVNGNLKTYQQMSELCVSTVLNDLQTSKSYIVTFKEDVVGTFRLTCEYYASTDTPGEKSFAQHDWEINSEVDQGETDWAEMVKETNDLVKENNEMLKALTS